MQFSKQGSRCLNNNAIVFFPFNVHILRTISSNIYLPCLANLNALAFLALYFLCLLDAVHHHTAMCLIFNSSLIKNLLREPKAITIKYGSKITCVHVCICVCMCVCSILVFWWRIEYNRIHMKETSARKLLHRNIHIIKEST